MPSVQTHGFMNESLIELFRSIYVFGKWPNNRLLGQL
jgi:hypothetical protein